MKFYVYKIGDCFEVTPEPRENEDYEVTTFEAIHTPVNGSSGFIGISFGYLPSYLKFNFSDKINGEYQKGVYVSLWWEIRDKQNITKIVNIKGEGSINVRFSNTICKIISKFLTELYQFDSLEDYIKFQNIKDTALWKTLNFKDKLLMLADIIKLYDKYLKINPAINCVQEFEKELKEKLPSLLKELEV